MHKIIFACLLLAVSMTAIAESRSQRGEFAYAPDNLTVHSEPPMANYMKEEPGRPLYSIEAAAISAPDQLDQMSYWNLFNTPIKNGFSHYLPSMDSIEISGPGGALESNGKAGKSSPVGQLMYTADGDVIWYASVQVEGSHRLRLNLADVSLPPGAHLWVYGSKGDFNGPFGMELADSTGQIWTPSVSGPEIKLVVMVPEGDEPARFMLDRVLQLFELNSFGEPILQPQEDPPPSDTSCLLQTLCVNPNPFSPIENVEKSIGAMEFVVNGEGSVCTGGLVADTDPNSTRALFLTANHCFETQDVATTLQVFWDFKSETCNVEAPDKTSMPNSSGSTLLATGKPADFTLLELNSIPAGRYFLPYNKNESAAAPGVTLYRVSHPLGKEQHYSQSTVSSGTHACGETWTDTTHIWQSYVQGSTLGGSSGSPVLTAAGEIVGQLSGTCGEEGATPDCKTEPTIDGRLSNYFNEVAQFLEPSSGGTDTGDLAVANVSVPEGSYSSGSTLQVNTQVNNVGNAASNAYTVTYYASTDSTITTADYSLGTANRASVSASASDQFVTSVVLSNAVPAGAYYIGAILTVSDSNSSNNTGASNATISVTSGNTGGSVSINAGMNGSWYNLSMNGQGILVDVLTSSNQVFAAWFTYDSVRPPAEATSVIGGPGLRWVTALGPISGDKATLTVYFAEGGVFASGTPPVQQTAAGTMTLTFLTCKSVRVDYDIQGVGAGSIEMVRLTNDAVAQCEAGQ